MNVLFVCGWNTCRSAMAQAVAQHLVSELGLHGITIDSAGPNAEAGRASPEAIQVAAEHGLDLAGHQAKKLTDRLVDWADLVVGMEPNHVRAAEELGAKRALLLTENGVKDPYGNVEDCREVWLLCERKISPLLASELVGNGWHQVAAVPYRIRDGELEFCLVLSDSKRWLFPKGDSEAEYGRADSLIAEEEARQEAGLVGRTTIEPFTHFFLEKQGAVHAASAFLLPVTGEGSPEEDWRDDPEWVTAGDARERFRERRERVFAEELIRVLDEVVALLRAR